MKITITSLLILLTIISHHAKAECKFNILRTKVKIWHIYLDSDKNKEVEKVIARLSGKFILSNAADKRIFQTKKGNFKIANYKLSAKYDYYTDSVNMDAWLNAESLKNIIKTTMGSKKLNRYPLVSKVLKQVKDTKINSSFYQFHGSYYGQTDDQSFDYIRLVDPENPNQRIVVEFDFQRRPRCK